ncbi:MAG: tRNA (adenosine(37)-N6)-dimethylallyltransferase MiaA [Propionibacteriaceae bacterium]|jgi:tRNA dimethylallyltransferase|nr:tRNA (adenosine(37)-N6)-dimethylallyltransferase MiaA [Propionibacteriaceae bacterium]
MTLGVLVLLGPTASGKSDLALRVARWLMARGQPAAIVNADSMLVYRGMDIGTAKPSPAERAEVPHYLVDTMELTEPASVAEFQRAARAAIADCRRDGVQPIVVGGSALYLRAITDRFEFPPSDPATRAALEEELAALGPAPLYARLQALDPAAAAGIQPANGRRIVRALEVIAVTGSFRSTLPEPTYELDGVVQVGLALDRARMDARITARVDAMWANGLPGEVQSLLADGLRDAPTAAKAIGYRQTIDFLDGKLTETQAKELIALRTRQFSRRQLAWWRRDPRITWLPAEPPPAAAALAALLPGLSRRVE